MSVRVLSRQIQIDHGSCWHRTCPPVSRDLDRMDLPGSVVFTDIILLPFFHPSIPLHQTPVFLNFPFEKLITMSEGNQNLFTQPNPFGGPTEPPTYDDERSNELSPLSTDPSYHQRRRSVSAESLDPIDPGSGGWEPPKHAKTVEQRQRLYDAIRTNLLFRGMEDKQIDTILDALSEKPVPDIGTKILTQGEEGHSFYIIEVGEFDVYINPTNMNIGPNGWGKKVGTMAQGECFGELALMYNSLRAATIVSAMPNSVLWTLDRITFRRILLETAVDRRRMYERFLREIPLFSTLEHYDRTKIADGLQTVEFSAGETIIPEGEIGDCMYVLEHGEVAAYKSTSSNPTEPIKQYHTKGDYFGELSLLYDRPRAATIMAESNVKLARLDRGRFQRLLGPTKTLMLQQRYDENALGD